ncbi:putative pantothenate transporter [Xylariomycetidae sp. FL0641]|nr:putative pantothenate transporter [Xylariomycetidae sp. FL0641]
MSSPTSEKTPSDEKKQAMTAMKTPSLVEATASQDEFAPADAPPAPAQDAAEADEDAALARRVRWKLDLFILPMISGVYFFAAMGRSDLANAKIAGLTEELRMSPQAYSNAATIFLVSYTVFQLPGTVLIKQIRAPRQFAGAMLLWGLFTCLCVLVQTTGQLLALRFLIGAAEAFIQGGVFYLSFWYEYHELATRGAVFFSMSTLAGACNGLIAYGIAAGLDGARGWRAWRWIFLVEGLLPVAFAGPVLLGLPESPAALRWGFTPREKAFVVRRALRAHNAVEARLELRKVPEVLRSLHFWLFAVVACGGHFLLASMSAFLPSLIEGFGYTEVVTQAYTVLVYACAFVGTLFFCLLADRTNQRGLVLAGSTLPGIAGYAMLIALESRRARFAATCLVAFSIYPNIVLQLSWAAMNFVGYTRRGSALAFFSIISQFVAIGGTQAYKDPPYYRKGNSASLGMAVLVVVASLVLRWYLNHMNKKRQSQLPDVNENMSQQSIEQMGDRHPNFRFTS